MAKTIKICLIIVTILLTIYTMTSAIGWTNHGDFVLPLLLLCTLLSSCEEVCGSDKRG